MKLKIHLLLMMLICFINNSVTFAADLEIGGISYKIIGNHSLEIVNRGYHFEVYTTPDGSLVGREVGGYSGSIVIPDTIVSGGEAYAVTSIGIGAFMYCHHLDRVIIPNTVRYIENNAFWECSNLEYVYIGDSVEFIGSHAFYACSKLAKINIPNSVSLIDQSAFMGCSSATEITFGNSVTEIGEYAFEKCSSVKNINLPMSVHTLGDYSFAKCNSLTSIDVPNSVTTLGDGVFSQCENLKTATIGNSIKNLQKTFYNCVNLEEVNLGISTEEIKGTFNGCKSLKSITIPESVKTIGGEAFKECVAMQKLIISRSNDVLYLEKNHNSDIVGMFEDCPLVYIYLGRNISYDNSPFQNLSTLENLTIDNYVTSIGASDFERCTGLSEITIPSNVTKIGASAFSGCIGLKSLRIDNANTELEISDLAFNGSAIENLYIGRDLNGWRNLCISNSAKSVIIENVDKIEDYAFSNYIALKSIVIGNKTRDIGAEAFKGCNTLASVTFGNSISTIGKDAFEETNIDKVFWLQNTEPKIKGKVTYVSTSNMSTDDELKRFNFINSRFEQDGIIYIPISPNERTAMVVDVNYIHSQSRITVPETVTYKDIDLKVIDSGNYSFSRYSDVKHFKIEAPLPSIPDGFAYKCSGLEDFTVSQWQTYIGKHAFEDCASLADFVILDWSTDVEVGINAFRNTGLKSLRQGRQLKYPDIEVNSPFAGNATLENVWVTDIPTSVGPYQFKGCPKLSKVNIGDCVETIEHYAFSGCKAIESFAFGSAVTRIGEEAFSDCSGMKNLYAAPIIPPVCGSQALDDINRWECTLHLKPEAEADYAVAPQWKEFLFKDNAFGIVINITSHTICVGESLQLEVVSNNAEGEVNWKSTNESVIKVSENGIVTAISEGVASVAAINSDGLIAKCVFSVIDKTAATDIVVAEGSELGNIFADGLNLFVGESRKLLFTVVPATATSSIAFKSSNDEVATIDSNGYLTTVAEGMCEIIISCDNIWKSVTVNVSKRPQSIIWQQEFDNVNEGDVLDLTATASSGLEVEYVVIAGDASISGSKLMVNSPGEIIVEATQPGNVEFLHAESIRKVINASSGFNLAFADNSKIKIIGNELTIKSGEYALYDIQGHPIKTGIAPISITLQTNKTYVLHLGNESIKLIIK